MRISPEIGDRPSFPNWLKPLHWLKPLRVVAFTGLVSSAIAGCGQGSSSGNSSETQSDTPITSGNSTTRYIYFGELDYYTNSVNVRTAPTGGNKIPFNTITTMGGQSVMNAKEIGLINPIGIGPSIVQEGNGCDPVGGNPPQEPDVTSLSFQEAVVFSNNKTGDVYLTGSPIGYVQGDPSMKMRMSMHMCPFDYLKENEYPSSVKVLQ